MIDINDFIDYDSLFYQLYQEQREVLREYVQEIEHYNKIVCFYEHQLYAKTHGEQVFEILTEECTVEFNKIVFVYGMEFDDANESNPQNSSADYTIIYDRHLNKFINCEYEQG